MASQGDDPQRSELRRELYALRTNVFKGTIRVVEHPHKEAQLMGQWFGVVRQIH